MEPRFDCAWNWRLVLCKKKQATKLGRPPLFFLEHFNATDKTIRLSGPASWKGFFVSCGYFRLIGLKNKNSSKNCINHVIKQSQWQPMHGCLTSHQSSRIQTDSRFPKYWGLATIATAAGVFLSSVVVPKKSFFCFRFIFSRFWAWTLWLDVYKEVLSSQPKLNVPPKGEECVVSCRNPLIFAWRAPRVQKRYPITHSYTE